MVERKKKIIPRNKSDTTNTQNKISMSYNKDQITQEIN